MANSSSVSTLAYLFFYWPPNQEIIMVWHCDGALEAKFTFASRIIIVESHP